MTLATAKASAIAAWDMNEASGTRADQVGSADMTDVNTVASTTGLAGNAASLVEASSERMYASLTPPAGTTFTLAFYFRTSEGTLPSGILGWSDANDITGINDREIYLTAAGKLEFRIFDGLSKTVVSDSALNDGNWHSCVAAHDAGTMKLYIDGTQQAATTASGAGYNGYTTPFLLVGCCGSGGIGSQGYTDVDIDELAVLDGYALNGTEAAEHWASGAGLAFADWDAAAGDAVPPCWSSYRRRRAA